MQSVRKRQLLRIRTLRSVAEWRTMNLKPLSFPFVPRAHSHLSSLAFRSYGRAVSPISITCGKGAA